MKKSLLVAIAAILACSSAQAAPIGLFNGTLLGINEVGPFDPDGSATATASIDYATGQIDWAISFVNLATVVGAHIHSGAAGINGPIIIDFTVPPGLSGSGSFSGSLFDADTLGINAQNAGNFYFNVHTTEFRGGAVRGQLQAVPEPATIALMFGGLAALGAASRRRPR